MVSRVTNHPNLTVTAWFQQFKSCVPGNPSFLGNPIWLVTLNWYLFFEWINKWVSGRVSISKLMTLSFFHVYMSISLFSKSGGFSVFPILFTPHQTDDAVGETFSWPGCILVPALFYPVVLEGDSFLFSTRAPYLNHRTRKSSKYYFVIYLQVGVKTSSSLDA